MKQFTKDFLLGAATAAHQVEGNNKHSDFWCMENLSHSDFSEPSLDAVDHYNHYEEDIKLMAEAGLNAYRFSIEWARIEPEKGYFDDNEIEHYRKVLQCCRNNGIEPIVTMHHFSSPKWLITEGGWESEKTVDYFARYCKYVVEKLGEFMTYVCTINEANMGIQIAAVAKSVMRRMGVTPQIGMNFEQLMESALQGDALLAKKEKEAAFGVKKINDFLSMRTPEGDMLIMKAHQTAKAAMKSVCPHLKVGLTLSLYDLQPQEDGEEEAAREWEEDFLHYVPYIEKDDFIGVQNYSRKLVDAKGAMPNPKDAEVTQMNYEFYPWGLPNVIRKVYAELGIPVIVTENGIATTDDSRRMFYIQEAIRGVQECIDEGIPVKGYCYWSLLDNFEWQKGFGMTFGLIAVDRATQTRYPKESLSVLGSYRK